MMTHNCQMAVKGTHPGHQDHQPAQVLIVYYLGLVDMVQL